MHLIHQDFYHLFLLDLFVITRLLADGTCSPEIFAFYLHFCRCIKVGVIGFDISKWHCEDLSSYQTITLLLQRERLKKLRFTPLSTTVYLSHLTSSTPTHNLSSNRFQKRFRNKGCFIFLQEIGRRITKSNLRFLK